MATVLMPLPSADFDPTESSVPWRALVDAGHAVRFATPDGLPAAADHRTLTGEGLAPWGFLRAGPEARAAYEAMRRDPAFGAPIAYADLDPAAFDALLLTGGHAPGMRPYLESEALYAACRAFFEAERPVGAVCHGVLVPGRARGADGRSLLRGRRVTALTKPMELFAYTATRWRLGTHYLTYPETTVEEELCGLLEDPSHFARGPLLPVADSAARPERGFVVRDGNLVTARWPGDANRLGQELVKMLRETR